MQPSEGSGTAPPNDADAGLLSEIETMLQPLVQRLLGRNRTEPAKPGEVLLDIDMDGVHYLLVEVRPEVPEPVLTPREREIARLVALGYPNKTIAAALDISSWTVATHLRRVFAELGVRSRAAMVAQLAALGFRDSESKPRKPTP